MSLPPKPSVFVDDTSDIATRAYPPTQGHFARTSSASALAGHLRRKPNLVVTLLLLILIGLRPARLSEQLRASDEVAWLDFRASLIQRWQTVMITTGLVMGAAASAVFSDKVAGGSYLMAMASLCCAVVAITFGTGLSFVFQDAPPRSIVVRLHSLFVRAPRTDTGVREEIIAPPGVHARRSRIADVLRDWRHALLLCVDHRVGIPEPRYTGGGHPRAHWNDRRRCVNGRDLHRLGVARVRFG